jgi:UDP-N-acetylmuramoyl-tripeptide--D-alanyl-D-alanine ligase
MESLSVEEIVKATGGKLVVDSKYKQAAGVSIDTRLIKPGELFVPLIGETDGHRFIATAIESGAAGILYGQSYDEKESLSKKLRGCFAVEVGDTLKAFQDIAKYYRKKLGIKVVAITGSTGKTTTKDMINCVLTQKYRVVSTEGNFNNEIGVPLTIFRADKDTEIMVVEMAMRGRGQIKELAEIAKPDIGVLTNIGQAHIELLGSEQAIAEAKAELIESLPAKGAVILNGDDLWASFVMNRAKAKVVSYGITTGDVQAERIEVDVLGRVKFSLIVENDSAYTVRLPVPGRHNVYNALAASAVGLELGLTSDQIRIGLSNCRLSAMRMEVLTTADNVVILNDAYNANPTAMQAALSTLLDVKTEGRRIAVLGDMLELGQMCVEAHKQIGKVVASLGIDYLIAVGNESLVMAESAVRSGMKPKAVVSCIDADTAGRVLKQLIEPDDVVLVKASRAIGLEAVVKAMVKI